MGEEEYGKVAVSDGKLYPTWMAPNKDVSRVEDDMSQWLNTRTLAKGESYTLPATVNKVQMGLRWDKGADVDASVAVFDADQTQVDAVWYRCLKSKCGSITHSGDNLTGRGDGDDETITTDFTSLPYDIHYILFIVTVFSCNRSFHQVKNLAVQLRHGETSAKGDVLFSFSLSELSGHAMLVGQLVRKGAQWQFEALGAPVDGRTVADVVEDGTIKGCMTRSPSIAAKLRDITVSVLEGSGLAAKDFSLPWRRRTSDPYYIVSFRNKEMKSKPRQRTLEPVWEPMTFSLGRVTASESELLKISVFDYDMLSQDDFMGMVQVAVNKLFKLGPGKHFYWFDLEKSQEKAHRNEKVTGSILIKIDVQRVNE